MINTELSLPIARWGHPARAATTAIHEQDRTWDPLMICIAGYVLVAVGRVHQLFPVIGAIRPAILMGGLAIVLYLVDGHGLRRLRRVRFVTTMYVIALLVWMTLSTPGAIRLGTSFDQLIDNFKTVLMFFIIAAGVRGLRDVQRVMIMYLASAAIYAAVILLRFDLGEGDAWRLGHLYYYDANDFAT